jgi:DNA-binding GntR family transcriptional regulator
MGPRSDGAGSVPDALAHIEPLGRSPTVEEALASEIRRLIFNNVLSPGLRLRYRDLASQFGVSVTPVRAAIRELSKDGLVEWEPGGGARVARFSVEELEEIYAARAGLEGLLARRGAENAGGAVVAAMAVAMKTLEQLAQEPNEEAYLRGIFKYRLHCYEAAKRPQLLAQVQLLVNRSMRYNWLTLKNEPRRIAESLDMQRRFLHVCRERDGMGAQELIRENMDWALDYLSVRVVPVLSATTAPDEAEHSDGLVGVDGASGDVLRR